MELAGKVAVVTGGASGIGKAMAARFRDEGMTVVIADIEQARARRDGRRARRRRGAHRRQRPGQRRGARRGGGRAPRRLPTSCATTPESAAAGGSTARRCATGSGSSASTCGASSTALQAFLPIIEANPDGGHIVNTASMAGLAPFPGIGVYNATKYAVVGISETLAIEQAGSGVGVSVLCPGVVNTNIFRSQRKPPRAPPQPAAQRRGARRQRRDDHQEGIDPAVVAEKVAHAIREGEFWIITHPDLLTHVDARHRALMRHALDH